MLSVPPIKSILVGLLVIALGACGGGGGGGGSDGSTPPPPAPPAPVAQTLTFASAGPVSLFIDEMLTNAASGPGSGAVSYASSNSAIATVDATGRVTAVGPGTVLITATKAADATYQAASASYLVDVTSTVPFAAWVGSADTRVDFPAIANGMSFYRSSQPDCDLAQYASCSNGQLDILNGTTVVDSAASLAQIGYYVLQRGNRQGAVTVSTAHFSARSGHAMVSYDNQLWIVGGVDANSTLKNDVWSSPDGITWVRRTASAAFSPREHHQVVAYGNKLWVIGGADNTAGTHSLNDVWSSTDGINWTQQASSAGFSARNGHQTAVYRDRIWVIGGLDNGLFANDVWSSADGITWVQETSAAAFAARAGHQVVVFADRLWLIGGADYGTLYNDVWSSVDGVDWTLRSANAAFAPRTNHRVVAYGNELVLVGGYAHGIFSGNQREVWSSPDGVNWTPKTLTPAFSPRSEHQLAVFRNQLWLTGGLHYSYRDDVWSSRDGVAWTEQSAIAADFSARDSHQIVAFHDKLWLIGGRDYDTGLRNDVWSSVDGMNWTLVNPAAAFSAREGHQVVVFDDKLWVIGGADNGLTNNGYANDAWSSSDGVNWTQATSGAMFSYSPRADHQVVVFNNKLLLVGGRDWLGYKNDVWSSSDGRTWGKHTTSALFSARTGHQLVVYDNQAWVIGGNDNPFGIGYRNDVWSTSDGFNWTQRNAAAAFTARSGHEIAVHDNQLWLVGGTELGTPRLRDVWSSADGVNWTQRTSVAAFAGRTDFRMTDYDNRLWLIGGDEGSTSASNGLRHDVWSSSDGVEWRLGVREAFVLQ